jgi:hypothetical protein
VNGIAMSPRPREMDNFLQPAQHHCDERFLRQKNARHNQLLTWQGTYSGAVEAA